MPSASVVKELNCTKCGKPLVKNGKVKCPRCKQEIELPASLPEGKWFCPECPAHGEKPHVLAINGQIKCRWCDEDENSLIQKEEKMERKKFREIRDWDEWLELWKKNDIEAVALGLLKYGLATDHCERLDDPIKLRLEKYRFYLDLAKSYYFPFDDWFIGNKAFEHLIAGLNNNFVELGSWWDISDDPEFISFFEELVDFFAKKVDKEHGGVGSKVEKIIESFWIKPEYYEFRSGPKIHKKFLAAKKAKKKVLIKMLLTLKDYRFLYEHNLLKEPTFKEEKSGAK